MMMKEKRSDVMVYSTFYEGIKYLINSEREDVARELALEYVYYGVFGERKHIFEDCKIEARMRSFMPYIDQSKKNCQETIERKARYKAKNKDGLAEAENQ